MRKTKYTLKQYKPIARTIAEEANRLDVASRRLHKLAEQVNQAEIDAATLDRIYMVKVEDRPAEQLVKPDVSHLTWPEQSMGNKLSPALREAIR